MLSDISFTIPESEAFDLENFVVSTNPRLVKKKLTQGIFRHLNQNIYLSRCIIMFLTVSHLLFNPYLYPLPIFITLTQLLL